jgi:molybdopterin-biosynthesis enzyme MoeA-like protein
MSKLLNGRFSIQQAIGGGGFAHTYLGVDHHTLDRPCVIKQLHLTDPIAQQLFHREADQLDKIGKHPHIPALYAYFEEAGYYYLVEEYLPGMSLRQMIAQKGRFSEEEVRGFLSIMLPVLEFLHGRQLVHRDIKPDNVMFSNGTYHLIDFGAVKQLASHTGGTAKSLATIISSSGYTAPEQYHGQASYPADIFSLGATCVEMLTGQAPGTLYDAPSLTWRWRHFAPPGVTQEFCAVIDRMIEPSVQARFRSAREVAEALTGRGGVPAVHATTTQTVQAIPKATPISVPAGAQSGQKPLPIGIVVLIVLMVGGAAGFIGFSMQPVVPQRTVEEPVRPQPVTREPAAANPAVAERPIRRVTQHAEPTPAPSAVTSTPTATPTASATVVAQSPRWERVSELVLPSEAYLIEMLDDGSILYVEYNQASGILQASVRLRDGRSYTTEQQSTGIATRRGSLLYVQKPGSIIDTASVALTLPTLQRAADISGVVFSRPIPSRTASNGSGTKAAWSDKSVVVSEANGAITTSLDVGGLRDGAVQFSDSGRYLLARSVTGPITAYVYRRAE